MASMTLAFVECEATDFVWWLRRNQLRLPDLLDLSPSTRIPVDVDELVEWASQDEDRSVRVTNDPSARPQMHFPQEWSARLRETAAELARLLMAPRWVCFAARVEGQDQLFSAGIAGQSEAVVFTDDGSRVRLARLRSTEVAAEVAHSVLPRNLPTARFMPVRVSARVARGAAGNAAKALYGAGADQADVDFIMAVDATTTAGGFFGAGAYTPDGQCPGPFAGQWREAPLGGCLVIGEAGQLAEVQPLSVSGLTRALVEAVALSQ